MAKILEVAVDSLASARAAIRGGADRLELCSALSIGGLTPYAELLRQIRKESNITVRCLMRPRAGDFLYTKEEIDQIEKDIQNVNIIMEYDRFRTELTPDISYMMNLDRMDLGKTITGALEAAKDRFHEIRDAIPEENTTVGIALSVQHIAATPVGHEVRAEAVVTAVDGKIITFDVAAYDESGKIGEGTHKRAIVNKQKFLDKTYSKL